MNDVNWVQILQLFISLSILITLHEFGHFAAAKYFKTRVDKFYLFFDFLFPLANVLNFSLFKKKIGETEYGIGWFPLGGYVKIAGMVDESMDKDQMNQPPQPWEYRSKPAWQRLIIIMGGILVNFFLGMVIFMFVLGIWGKEYLPTQNLKYGLACDSMLLAAGLQNGDNIIKIDGVATDDFSVTNKDLLIGNPEIITVMRNGALVDVAIKKYKDANTFDKLERTRRSLIEPRIPFKVKEVMNADLLEAGMKKEGDQIVSVNGRTINYFDEFKSEMILNANKMIKLKTVRADSTFATYDVLVPETGRLGVMTNGPADYLEFARIDYNAFEAIPAGASMTFEKLTSYVKGLGLLFDTEVEGYKHIGGFGAMAKGTPREFSMEGFLIFTAVISIILAFMNFLPIPMLDGGYVVFILYEMITRKQPSEKFMEVTNYIGMIFLLGLMLYANGNDIYKGFFK